MSIKSLTNRQPSSGLRSLPDDIWQRPSDWLTLDILGSSDQKVIGLMAVFDDDVNYIAFTCSGTNGDYTVDWGDGITENISTGVKAQHRYNFSDISSSTLTSEGFRQAIITITPQAGKTLGSIDFQQVHSDCSSGAATTLTELKVAITGSLSLSNYTTNVAYFPELRILTIANHTTNMTSTLLRGNAQNVTQFFITKALNINGSGPFQYADSLEYVYTDPGFTVADCSNLFLNCTRLKYPPLLNTSSAANFTSMFQNCYVLKTVPLYNMTSCTNATSMFNSCYSLTEVPAFKMTACTNYTSMFQNCYSLKTIPNFSNNTSSNNTTSMFQNCYNLLTVDLFTVGSISTSTSMFNGCVNLNSIPFFNIANNCSPPNMFAGCISLNEIPEIFDGKTSLGMGSGSIFNTTSGYKKHPKQIFFGTNFTNNVGGNYARDLTPYNGLPQGAGSLSFSGPGVRKVNPNCSTGVTLNGCRLLGKIELNRIFSALNTPSSSRSLTITSNVGANINPIYSRSSTTTSGSTTITISDTSNFVVGTQVTGTGIDSARSVTLTDAGDTVTLAGHGIPNGKLVSFTAITSTTGISVYTPYYVVNATTDTFQLSLTDGGSAIALTTNGSGTLIYQTLITGITANTSVTIDVPASVSGTNTLAYRNLNTQIAVMKRWTITG